METLGVGTASKPPTGRKMKARAPPPPQAPQPAARRFQGTSKLSTEPGELTDQNLRDRKENMMHRTLTITVVLPGGIEKFTSVSGSKAVMDLLVDLCSQYHLNPSQHTLELQSTEMNHPLDSKPNTPIGMLNVHRAVIKEKVLERAKRPPPKMPEKTVRLVVNFLRTQKAVVRVSPLVPLRILIPVICEKCDLDQEHVVLLKDNISREELPLSKSLNMLGIRELYASDSSRETVRSASISSDPTEKEERGLLGFLRLNQRKNKTEEQTMDIADGVGYSPPAESSSSGFSTAPNSPSAASRSNTMGPLLSLGNISRTSPKTEMKKRRAPPPPAAAARVDNPSRSVLEVTQSSTGSLNEMQQKKRRAPPPPTPIMQNKLEEIENNRRSTTVGLEWEQGSSTVEQEVDTEQLELEETGSVGSSSISEEDAEDSGIVGSPSDIASPEPQSGSLRHQLDWQHIASELNAASEDEPRLSSKGFSSDSNEVDLAWSFQHRDENKNWTENRMEDDEVSTQLQQTLAELDADLEEIEEKDYKMETLSGPRGSTELSTSSESELGPADIEYTVPVIIIDGRFEDYVFDTTEKRENVMQNVMKLKSEHTLKQVQLNSNLVNSNNNACTSKMEHGSSIKFSAPLNARKNRQFSKSSSSPLPQDRHEEEAKSRKSPTRVMCDNQKRISDICGGEVTHIEYKPQRSNKSHKSVAAVNLTSTKEGLNDSLVKESNAKRIQPKSETKIENCSVKKDRSLVKSDPLLPSIRWQRAHNTQANHCDVKAGMNTFTVIPPKPAVKLYNREGVSISTGAIKIDDQGNLINPQLCMKKSTVASSASENEECLIGKAKAFWNLKHGGKSFEDSASTAVVVESTVPSTSHKTQNQEAAKQSKAATEQLNTPTQKEDLKKILPVQEPQPSLGAIQSQVKRPTLPLSNESKTTVPFTVPYRRTSSQYMASVISKCTGITSAQARPNENNGRSKLDHEDSKKQKNEFESVEKKYTIVSNSNQVEVQQPINRNYHSNWNTYKEPNKTSVPQEKPTTDNTRSVSSSLYEMTSINFSGRKKQPQFPSSVSKENSLVEKQLYARTTNMECSEMPSDLIQQNEKLDELTSQLVSSSSFPSATSASYASSTSTIKLTTVQTTQQSGSSKKSHFPADSGKPITAASRKLETLLIDDRTESAVLENAGVFGPVKKFKPVLQKPVQKDVSLHSSLMEAIQSGEGKERLRKTENMANAKQKKPSFIETENERSALLAAIRAHSGNSRLRKTSSAASEDLQNIKNAELTTPSKETSLTEELPIPPPPPPVSAIAKKPAVCINSKGNPEDARQALLEAIRSGSGAAQLRKAYT
ncbi:protein cordon-bleu isoform X2 [Latimeria chalumnae]|uniref:protein cordon-bleu isoform X2 n=1 Tax=Latimeria chalumnae TaxID=7897 RepID=UPI0006D8DBBA|nr:PREDICTED: protein cordon-bleu isoform X2 [Latimeria chalumnae]|eukprot:XP_014346433.1 PREDICTED: protein cordon-bleu isoform X2 [Latimeria chalumnae]